MIRTTSLLSFILLIFFSGTTWAQSNCQTFFGSPWIISMSEDSSSIWVGTENNGLIRFDRQTQTQTVYHSGNSALPNNRIKGLHIHNGKLWVSTDSSLHTWNGSGFDLISDTLEGRMTDAFGQLAIVGRRKMHLYDNGSVTQTHDLVALVGDACCSQNSDIALDSLGNLWISHYDFYVFNIMKFDGVSWTVYDYQNSPLPIESFQQNGIAASPLQVAATNWKGLYFFQFGAWTLIHGYNTPTIYQGSDTLSSGLSGVEFDGDGDLWVGEIGNIFSQGPARLAYESSGQWNILPVADSSISRIDVILPSLYEPGIIYAGTPTGLIRVEKSCLVNSPEELIEIQFDLYPNPADRQVIISLPERLERGSFISMRNMQGKLILKVKIIEGSSLRLQTEDWPAGAYFVEVNSGDKSAGKIFLIQ